MSMFWARYIAIPWLSLCITAFAGSDFAYSRPLSFDKYDDPIRSAVKRYWPDFPDWKYWKSQLYQESQLDPSAASSVGAEGLAQFMPQTWADVTHQLGWSGVSATEAGPAIDAGSYYMARLRASWGAPRPELDRHWLAEASYNSGMGNILKAQKLCGGKALWSEISPCLPTVTGALAQQTITYVSRIEEWRRDLGP